MDAIMGGVDRPFSRLSDRIGGGELPLFFTGSGTWTAPDDGVIEMWAWGAGSSGARNSGSNGSGGGGGSALFKKMAVRRGDQITSAPGVANGNRDTVVTLPGGAQMTAGGGGAPRSDVGGLGGIAQGGDINVPGQDGVRSSTAPGGAAGLLERSILASGRGGSAANYPANINGKFPGGAGGGVESTSASIRSGEGADGYFGLAFYAGAAP